MFIGELRAKIDGQSKITEDLNAKTEEEKKVNKIEEERFRKLAQMNAALRAKLEFIQSKYDFTTNVKVLNTDDFNSLMNSNNTVSFPKALTSAGERNDDQLPRPLNHDQDGNR